MKNSFKVTKSSFSIFSYPKINLALDILQKAQSDYHEIQTVFHQLPEPFDEITITPLEDNIVEVRCDNPEVPLDETNTVIKAARLLKKQAGVSLGARIFIKKCIPLMSGLGGGASNAVAALKGLAKIWRAACCIGPIGHHLSSCLLRSLAFKIGMDCNFFFHGNTALGTHFGEKIETLPPLPPALKIKIIDTGIKISSHEAYQWINVHQCGKNIEKTKKLIEGLREKNYEKILENVHNDFEEIVFEKYPQLFELKRQRELSSRGRVLLSGSGGALYEIARVL